ncbi:MAG: AI-2E family transporter, partial [Patescibacteria group bacterium]
IAVRALFYFFRDGEFIVTKLKVVSPLQDRYDASVITRLHDAINSVIRGALLIAVIQGILTGVGLTVFGVPNAVLWGSIAIIAALIPYVGTAAVLAPAIIYLFLIDRVGASVGLLAWGIVAVGLIDNFLGPRLVNRGIKLHPVVILLAVLGGLVFFGPLGYILGPLVISLLFALLDIYPLLLRSRSS